jgi:DnaK suppressor protein
MDKVFLAKQKVRLLEEKEKIESQIGTLKKEDPFSDPDHVTDNASSDTDAREEMGHLEVEAKSDDLKKRLQLIQAALRRIERGTYGVCIKTGKKIPRARLILVPEADSVVE